MAITPLPSAPLPTDTTAQFNTKAFAWVAALDTFTTQANALAIATNTNETNAETAEANAETAQVAAEAAQLAAETAASNASATANVTQWVSGTTYAIGNNVYSLVDFGTYRRKTNGGGVTDPSADSTNWQSLGLPSQSGNNGKFLQTNGSTTSWQEVNTTPFSNLTALSQIHAVSLYF